MSSPTNELTGSSAVVTGSSSGIGRAIALELAAAGAAVVVHARRSADAARSVAEQIRSAGGQAEVLLADLSDPNSHQSLVEQAWAACSRRQAGGIDIWIN